MNKSFFNFFSRKKIKAIYLHNQRSKILLLANAALVGERTTIAGTLLGFLNEDQISTNSVILSLIGGQLMTGNLVLAASIPPRALLIPATAINTIFLLVG